MKRTILLFCLMVSFVFEANSQTFNYQSAVRDNAGDLVTNQSIGAQLKILQGGASGTSVYTETHTLTSNAYGVINFAVGGGTTTNNFSAINWSTQDYWLEIALDITGGTNYVVIGSSQLMSVPYANYAATTGEKPSGLEQITEGSNTGWRLIGRDPANYGNIGTSAVDFSTSHGTSTTNGATGNYAVAMGERATASSNNTIAIGDAVAATNNFAVAIGYGDTASGYRSFAAGESNTASGSSSTALGYDNTASGYASMALGRGTTASGNHANAMGRFSVASGDNAIAIGTNTVAESNNSLAVGSYNVGGGNPTNWVATDPLFELGNGTGTANKSNAITVLKNGNTTINGQLTIDGDNQGAGIGYTLPAQDGAANQIMSTNGSGVLSWINPPSGSDNLGNHLVTQDLFLQDNHLRLRGIGDTYHGMGWYNTYNATAIDGPVVSGHQGGGLATNDGVNTRLALSWDVNRNVTISEAYTLPNADGTANQVMKTNGSGALSWGAINELPSGGTNGQILGVSGLGVQWLDYDEIDGDTSSTNEIELPTQSGQAGKVLTTDGASPSWTSDVSATSVATDALTVNNIPSFCADLNGTLVLSGAGNFFKVPTWRTSDATITNLHDNGDNFNETTGAFTAPVNGFYFFSAQVRFDNITTGYFRILLGIDGALSLDNGLHAIKNADANSLYHTLSVSGVLKLSAGDQVYVNAYSSSDNSWSLQSESGFSGYLISRF